MELVILIILMPLSINQKNGINGEKVGKYIDNEYDFIKKVCKELLKRMEDER